MLTSQILDYYRQHSELTDPGIYAALYDGLPHDVPGLARVVQGLLIPPYREALKLYGVTADEIDNATFGVRRMEQMLERIMRRYDAPLTVQRPPNMRIGAICRNFSTLLVSMLRHQGIPARLRVGFGGYFQSKIWFDHRITEYWNGSRWVLADAWVDEMRQRAQHLSFNLLDIGPRDPFLVAGEVWRQCRAGELDPAAFGDSETDIGMPPIRYALLHDFAALNKCEVLGNDDWGDLITKPEAELTDDDIALLDSIAEVTTHADTQFAELRALFEKTEYGQEVKKQLSVEAQLCASTGFPIAGLVGTVHYHARLHEDSRHSW